MKHISPSSIALSPSTLPIIGDTEAQISNGNSTNNLSPSQLKQNAALVDRTNNQTAVQAAKRKIRSKVREEWTWPPTSSTQVTLNLPESDSQWRERESDSSYSPPPDPYQYDSPEDVISPILSKKRKRQHLLQEELRWNEGLRCYVERRDVWSGARIHKSSTKQMDPTDADLPNGSTSPPRTPSPDQTTQLPFPKFAPPNNRIPPCVQSLPPSPPSASRPTPPSPSPTSGPSILIPLAPPLLPPSNPVRASITAATYPSIYSKVVLQGQTPTIPINLQDVVSALVQGWKKDGEWPPKSEALAAGTRGSRAVGEGEGDGGKGRGRELAKRGVGRFKRVLGLGSGHDGDGEGPAGG